MTNLKIWTHPDFYSWNCQFRLYRRLPHQKMGYKIFPGFKWYHQKYSSYVVRRLATSRDVAGFRSIRSREVFSDKQTNRESTYCKNKDNITITIDISQYQSLVYQVSKAKNTVRKSIILHWTQFFFSFECIYWGVFKYCITIFWGVGGSKPKCLHCWYFWGRGDLKNVIFRKDKKAWRISKITRSFWRTL